MNNRTKQVQFRMTEEQHADLKVALAKDRRSFTDFFNGAAEEYLLKRRDTSSKKYVDRNGGPHNA